MSSSAVLGCDICNSSAGGNLMVILPQFGNHFVGLRYQHSGFRSTHVPSLLAEGAGGASRETFHTMELFGRYYPHPRVQLMGFVPYRVSHQTT